MKPVLEHLPNNVDESFVVKLYDCDYYPTPWHFHPEYELVLVTESTGKRFVGDNISNFEPGNLAFLGPNLPHFYRNESVYYEPGSGHRAQSIAIQFLETSFGNIFSSIPETNKINGLFTKSARGLNITGTTNKIISAGMFELLELKGFKRWMKLLEMLELLANTTEFNFISGSGIKGVNEKESDRMEKVLEFVMNNYQNDISLKEAAAVANMAENSFSRYFSHRTRKTFTRYVNEVRLSHAGQLLVENKKNIIDICYECGFTNLSNFNRQFNKLYHSSPQHYRKEQLSKALPLT